jgi:hypothetical protein
VTQPFPGFVFDEDPESNAFATPDSPLPGSAGLAQTQGRSDARAAVAADFDFDLHKFFAWAKTHTAAERKAKQWLPTGPEKQGAPRPFLSVAADIPCTCVV